MIKNHYDTLEVSKYASDEVIKRAYKVLAKKYHPDLQEEGKKKEAEEMMKKINEAYNILTDKDKKEKYDKELEYLEGNSNSYTRNDSSNSNKTERKTSNTTKANSNKNINYSNNVNMNPKSQITRNSTSYEEMMYRKQLEEQVIRSQQEIINRQIEIENKMTEAYYNRLRSMGYTIVEPFSFKRFMKQVIAYLIIYGIIYISFRIPFINEYLRGMEMENPFIKILLSILRVLTGAGGL